MEKRARETQMSNKVCTSDGVFQNRISLEADCLRTSANFVSFFRTDVDEVLSEFSDFSVSVLSYQRWIINLRIGKFSN